MFKIGRGIVDVEWGIADIEKGILVVEQAFLHFGEGTANLDQSAADKRVAAQRLLCVRTTSRSCPLALVKSSAPFETAGRIPISRGACDLLGLSAGDPKLRHEIEEVVYAPLEAFAGSVSAEHGIGLLKRELLGLSRSPVELAVMRTLKDALDPKHVLNPGKIFG